MIENQRHTLSKQERICSKTQIDALFNRESSRSMTAFPIRLVYKLVDAEAPSPVQILVSVPKRCFNRAVKRNRVKRQIREAYRKNKHQLLAAVGGVEGRSLMMAFIWLDNSLHSSEEVEYKVKKLLCRVEENL